VRLSFGFYDRHQTGQLMSRATVDLQGVRFFLGYGLIFLFQNVITVASVTVVLLVSSGARADRAGGSRRCSSSLAYRYSHIAHPTLREVQQKLADVATVAEENIVGVHVVKSVRARSRRSRPSSTPGRRRLSRQTLEGEPAAGPVRAVDRRGCRCWRRRVSCSSAARMVTSGELTVGGFVAVQSSTSACS
jgi:ATP-binding cassette subfamily B protein